MTQTASRGIDELRRAMEDPVIVPGDPDFDDGRRVWNAGIDRRPSVIARCACAADVAAAIGLGREHDLDLVRVPVAQDRSHGAVRAVLLEP